MRVWRREALYSCKATNTHSISSRSLILRYNLKKVISSKIKKNVYRYIVSTKVHCKKVQKHLISFKCIYNDSRYLQNNFYIVTKNVQVVIILVFL